MVEPIIFQRTLELNQLVVGFRTAVTVELPCVSDFVDLIEVKVSNEQFFFIARCLSDDFAAWIAEVA